MKQPRLVISMLAVLIAVVSPPVLASPIYSLDFDVLTTTYDPNTGAWIYTGQTRVMDITYFGPPETQVPYTFADLLLTTTLLNDTSAATLASGDFAGGSLLITDSTSGITLLEADLDWMTVEETQFTPVTLISSQGELQVTGGTLQPIVPTIQMYGLAFINVDPAFNDLDVDSLATESLLNLTFAVPEPATMLLLSLGAVGMVVKGRRRA
jgi:hypothetical protein